MRGDWRFRLREQRAYWTAAALFVLIFALYIAKHQTGWTVPVLTIAISQLPQSPVLPLPTPKIFCRMLR